VKAASGSMVFDLSYQARLANAGFSGDNERTKWSLATIDLF
jgi:hypothetical protein